VRKPLAIALAGFARRDHPLSGDIADILSAEICFGE
jgi:hypothetical protein